MSTSVDQAFVRQYEREVHFAYQRKGSKLRQTVRNKSNVVGKSTTFQTVGKGMAATKARHGKVPVMNINHVPVECTLADFYAGEWIDALDELKINHDERAVAVNSGAYALGRKTDDLIITALNSSGVTPIAIGQGTEKAARNGFLGVIEALRDNDVDDEDQYGVVSWSMWSLMETFEEFASQDYISMPGPYADGKTGNVWRRWQGAYWMAHSGLPITSNVRTGFFYHKTAVGFASGSEIKSDIQWHNDHAAHFSNNMMSQGSVVIDAEGIQPFTIDESNALPTAESA